MRGGLKLADGTENPMPRRNLPWGNPMEPVPAQLAQVDARHSLVAVGATSADRSPYGVLNMAGNVAERTSTETERMHVIRGGDVVWTSPERLVEYMSIENQRADSYRFFSLGERCATDLYRSAAGSGMAVAP